MTPPPGFRLLPGRLDEAQQRQLADAVRALAGEAPPYRPVTPGGKAMRFQHRSAYDDIDSTYQAITAYLDEKGLEAQNLFIEEYLNTPKGPEDPDLEVDIYVFLR